ncbi:recombination protein RecT [Pseudomonas aeruginosa]|uniref:recombination protein RecT n=1 Tax=Pseudomonas aeruginosa TaxID=287 RepID=UPI0025CB3F73|nr:recombination protein RecT [Pseudomonas aeruginosa]EKJ7675431.1 recombination protein RecT [Pseudomonas aeruginosa]EKK5032698.1 recombination protein RecT [Pseudomonas aeruginosa]EKV8330427.1 recombination protein RecT [Pseudomonas aeruginosa]EKX0004769.1 recombination protein RecT [Pseudomonas aeruginosa]
MSATALKAAATGNVANNGQPKTLAHLMTDPKIKAQMALALPKHMTADRLARIALTEIRKVPALAKCNQESFLGAVMQCAQLGLEPGNALGHAYLLPFGNGKAKDGLSNVQLIIGYRGMIDLARRSGQIVSLTARTVHQNDQFSYRYGLDEDVQHVPGEGERGVMTHVYAVAKLKDGGVQFEVMSKADVDKVRATSKASGNGPWVTHYEEMAKKTVIRRLFKYLPVSIELQTAVTLDERADAGLDQDNASILTGEYSVVDDQSQDQVPDGVNTETGEVTEPAPGQQSDTGDTGDDELNLE